MKNNEINYDSHGPERSNSREDYGYGYYHEQKPKSTNFKNPVNYSNETNTVDLDSIRNINDVLVNYGMKIEDRNKAISEGISHKETRTFTDDLVVVTRKGISFSFNELDVRIRALILDTTVPKADIASLIVSEVSKYIPQDTGDILETLKSIKTEYTNTISELQLVKDNINSNLNRIILIENDIVVKENQILSNTSEINNLKQELIGLTATQASISSNVGQNTAEIISINGEILTILSKIDALEVGVEQANNEIHSNKLEINSINSQISTILNNINNIVSEISDLNTLINNNKSDITTEVNNIKLRISSNESNISNVISNINIITNAISVLSNDILNIENNIVRIESNIDVLESSSYEHDNKLIDLYNKVAEINVKLAQIKTSSDKIDGIILDVSGIHTQLLENIVEIERIKNIVDNNSYGNNELDNRLKIVEGKISNINDKLNNISTVVSSIQQDEELILTNRVKLINYTYYEMYEISGIMYVIKINKQNKILIKRVEEINNTFDIRYSQPFNIDELPTKLSDIEGVGYLDLESINI